MVSLKIRRKRKYSRRTNKQRKNNTKKRYKQKNKTRKLYRMKVMKGGTLRDVTAELMAHSDQRKRAAFDPTGEFSDQFYDSKIEFDETTGRPFILVNDHQRHAQIEGDKYLSHYDLMLLENIIDIIHDVVAEGSLSYDAKLSIDLIVKSYTAIYNYPEYNGWRLVLLGLLDY